jgi:hypothetical protein
VSVGTGQIHDFNPGITPSGLFWTQAVPLGSVAVDLDAGTASLVAAGLTQKDFFNIGNALFGGGPAPVAATVSFDVRWSGKSSTGKVDDAANDFALNFVQGTSTMSWSVTSGGATYTSTGAATSLFAQIAKERNGSFHPG